MNTFRVKIGKKYQDVIFISRNLPGVGIYKGLVIDFFSGDGEFKIHNDDLDNFVDFLKGKPAVKEEEIKPGLLIETINNDNYLPNFIPLHTPSKIKTIDGKRRVGLWRRSNLQIKPEDLINVELDITSGIAGLSEDAYRILDGEVPGQARAVPIYILSSYVSKIIED